MSAQQALERALKAAASAAAALEDGTATRITLDLQQSGIHPYRVSLLEEQYAYVGEVFQEAPTPAAEKSSGA